MTTANSIPVFTIISGCWSQVQYRALLLMPWLLMLRGPTPASKGVLLDYTSDWNVIALFRSLRKKRFSSDHSDTAGALGCEFSADGASRRPCAGLPP